jgi:uncharacterized protein (TIRG00374 family)
VLRSPRVWIGLAISVLLIGLLLWREDFGEIRDAFRDADYLWVLASLPVYFFGIWVRTLRWQYLLRPVARPSSLRLYPVVIIGLTVNNLIPARVGELARAYVLGEREKVSKVASLGTIAVDRLFDGLTLVPILAILGVRAGVGEEFDLNLPGPIDVTVGFVGLALIMAVLFGIALAILTALAISPGFQRLAARLALAVTPARLRPTVENLLESFYGGLRSFRSPFDLTAAWVMSGISWCLEAASYYLVGLAFGLDVGFDVYLLITAGANLAMSVIMSQGGVGPFEFVTKQTLIPFGVSGSAATAYAIGVHAVILLPVIVLGLYFLWSIGLSLGEVVKVPADERPVASTALSAKGGRE